MKGIRIEKNDKIDVNFQYFDVDKSDLDSEPNDQDIQLKTFKIKEDDRMIYFYIKDQGEEFKKLKKNLFQNYTLEELIKKILFNKKLLSENVEISNDMITFVGFSSDDIFVFEIKENNRIFLIIIKLSKYKILDFCNQTLIEEEINFRLWKIENEILEEIDKGGFKKKSEN